MYYPSVDHLLHLDSSIRAEGSCSRKLSARYAERKLSDKTFVVVTARDGGYGPGAPREGWGHREPWLRHTLSTLGVGDPVFVGTEFTLARESPAMIPLGLGGAEDESMADALAAIDALLEI
jgi:FMN-dependent NADH-azoreductase